MCMLKTLSPNTVINWEVRNKYTMFHNILAYSLFKQNVDCVVVNMVEVCKVEMVIVVVIVVVVVVD